MSLIFSQPNRIYRIVVRILFVRGGEREGGGDGHISSSLWGVTGKFNNKQTLICQIHPFSLRYTPKIEKWFYHVQGWVHTQRFALVVVSVFPSCQTTLRTFQQKLKSTIHICLSDVVKSKGAGGDGEKILAIAEMHTDYAHPGHFHQVKF